MAQLESMRLPAGAREALYDPTFVRRLVEAAPNRLLDALLAVKVADTESEVAYEDLFRRLKDRGLHGVWLVTSDDHRGLVKAVQKHFQGASWQRCQVHVARNALGKVGGKHQRAISASARAVFNAPTLERTRLSAGSGTM